MYLSHTFNLKEPNSNKKTIIYLRARIDGKYLKYSTGENINPKDWDFENQFPKKVKGRTIRAIEINSTINQLTRYSEKLQHIYFKLINDGINVTTSKVRTELDYEFKKTSKRKNLFFSVFDDFLQEKRDLGKITPQTIKRYENIRDILLRFSDEENYKLNFNSITNDFYVSFVKFSRKTLKHKDNTLGRNIGFIKTFMNWSLMKKYHRNYDFKNFKKTSSETDEIALTQEELDTMFNYDFSKNKRLEKVRDVFIFGCATGLRYSDYSKIDERKIRNDQVFINTQKQKSNLGVPLNSYSRKILEKYSYSLPLISPQKFREYIKEVAKKIGFTEMVIKTSFIGNKRIEEELPKYKMISTHTARRTFITLSLEKGMRPDIVMSITGHKSYSSFKKYIKLSTKIREEEMIKAWN